MRSGSNASRALSPPVSPGPEKSKATSDAKALMLQEMDLPEPQACVQPKMQWPMFKNS